MPVTLQDRQDILDLMTGWMHRDLASWDGLAQLLHPDGTIEVTWFEGLAKDFIEGSVKMGKSDFRSKHFIGQPIVRFNGQKAIAETNAMIYRRQRRARSRLRHSQPVLRSSREAKWRLEHPEASDHLRHGPFHLSARRGGNRS